jgi:hypothetical protein|nr:hypothetical protein [Actinophrys sol]
MYIQNSIEQIKRNDFLKFLTEFLYDIKNYDYFNYFIKLYFTLKRRFYKKFKNIKILKYYFTLISLEYLTIDPISIVSTKSFESFLNKKLNNLVKYNQDNIITFFFRIFSVYLPKLGVYNIYDLKKDCAVKPDLISYYVKIIESFEHLSYGNFDFLLMKAFIKNFRNYVDALVNFDSRFKNNSPICIEFFSYVSEWLESFETSFLRESNKDVGDLLKKDPNYKISFSEKLHETYNMLNISDYFMKLFNTKLFIFLNFNTVEYSLFNLDNIPLWRFFSKYLRPYNKVLIEHKEKIYKKVSSLKIFEPKSLYSGNLVKISKNGISQRDSIQYDTLIDSYLFEKDFINEYEKKNFIYSLNKYESFEIRTARGRKKKSFSLLELLRSEKLFKN